MLFVPGCAWYTCDVRGLEVDFVCESMWEGECVLCLWTRGFEMEEEGEAC